MSGFVVLVCGGRDYADRDRVFEVLDSISVVNPLTNRRTAWQPEVTLVVHGGAPGADSLAGEWAKSRGIPVAVVEARWKMLGRAAGPIRNRQMLDLYEPDLVVAFPGGPGTRDMVRQAREGGFQVHVVGESR